MKLATHFHLMPMLEIHEVLASHSHAYFSACCLITKKDNFIFAFYILVGSRGRTVWMHFVRQSACPPTNCIAIDSAISIHIFQSLVNVSHWLILTTQELYNGTLLLTNIKRRSHFEGMLWQRYAWERVELNLNTSGKDPSMHPTISKTVE
jgi:hypothetical protein